MVDKFKDSDKIKCLERLVKVLTRANKIEYRSVSTPTVKLYDVDPDDAKKLGWDEGVTFYWGADTLPNTWPLLYRPKTMPVVTLEVQFDVDPYAKIDELEKRLKEMKK